MDSTQLTTTVAAPKFRANTMSQMYTSWNQGVSNLEGSSALYADEKSPAVLLTVDVMRWHGMVELHIVLSKGTATEVQSALKLSKKTYYYQFKFRGQADVYRSQTITIMLQDSTAWSSRHRVHI